MFDDKVVVDQVHPDIISKNLDCGMYTSGPLHPFHEGVLAFQGMVESILESHVEEELKGGK